jgi:hypothetical protein
MASRLCAAGLRGHDARSARLDTMPSPTFAHSFPARSPRRSRILVLSLEIDIFRMSELPTMGIGGLLSAASAILRRSVADRGAFVWSVLIATLVLVLAGCSATSPYSSQANNPNPNQTAGVTAPTSAGQAAAPATSYAAPASAAQQDYSDSLPYPKQSLADLFHGSTQTQAPSQTQTVPHPPSTYAPSGQPYSPPPAQQPYGAPTPSATAAPPANPDPTDSLPYPKQSLIDLFSNK